MARSPKDEALYNDMQWKYRADAAENCAPSGLGERKQPPISSPATVLNDNSVYTNANYPNDVYLNKHFNVQAGDAATNNEEKVSFNNLPNVARTNRQNYGNAMLSLGNGQLVRVFYDENNQQLIVPMNGQYELFNPNQGFRDMPLQTSQHSPMFTLNHDYPVNNNPHVQQPPVTQNNTFSQDNIQNVPTSNFLKEVIGNWEPNITGTYSPFGQNYPLNHPETPTMHLHPTSPVEQISQAVKAENSPKRNENSPLADTGNKKRIVAEVKPMRPTYSDVLAKNTKNNNQTEASRRAKPQTIDTKPVNTNKASKPEKPAATKPDENKQKMDKKPHTNTISSGSESGDIAADDVDKRHKPNKKSKNKRNNISRKWSSLDNINNEEHAGYNDNKSQFVFIENQAERPSKKEKKSDHNKTKNSDKSLLGNSDFKLDDEGHSSQFVCSDSQSESKSRKKKSSNNHKVAKPAQDKKKNTQTKLRRNKPGYLGLAQNYLEHWVEVTWKAIVWFFYLLSDICHMSAHLSFDLCTSVFTQTYMSSQAVWRSSKDYISKIGHNKYLQYIDRKIGHTRFGFWRKLKWFKKDTESENNDSTKLNANIPLPATGEEAMKRLLACKGKDPYSILGVSVTCTDEEIKRYYRRQAFLVHPDKNQQPGAEEAFKILQHAFDLIGEPERRSAYSRRALESRHAEAAWGELSALLAQLHDKMEFAANTIRCTNCGRRHKRVLTERPCYAARYCAQCKIRHSAKEGDIWAESSMLGLLVMYYACMDGGVYQITQWASCQKKNLKQLRPDCHVVQYRIVLGNKAANDAPRPNASHEPNLEEFLNSLYSKQTPSAPASSESRRHKKTRP